MSKHLSEQAPRYKRIRESVMDMARDLDHQVIETSRGREESGPVVSEEELMHLLAEGE
jgi:molybdenum-dependent DNA-binding transcriptional regulator ModE